MKKVLLFGTHPRQFNGYSKVVYELAQCISKMEDIELTIYGFQNFYSNAKHRVDLPANVKIYDAYANENPKVKGFGQREVEDFVKLNNPDVCIIYNDLVVVSAIVTELKKIPDPKFKIIGYIDQVYLNQRKMFIEFINKNIDVSILFTKSWEDNIKDQGVKTPTHFLPHGFNPMLYYPIPKHIARKYFNLSMEDFIILNLNRNQPRKRWDICLKAFADIVSRYPDQPIKMIIGTSIQGEWNLLEVFQRELEKRNMTLEEGIKHLIVLDNPQKNTDEETNILYNVADIGLNTCDGEGFGLCNFEQAGIGIPQIVPRLGGFVDIFDDECATLLDPQMAYYVGTSKEFVGGEALLISYMDVADAIETYYQDKELREKHGQKSRESILKNFKWMDIAQKLREIIYDATATSEEKEKDSGEIKNLINEVDKVDEKKNCVQDESIDTETLDKLISDMMKTESNIPESNMPDSNNKGDLKDKNKKDKKVNNKQKKSKMRDEVRAIQKQLALMMQKMQEDELSEDDTEEDSE